jgi:NADPH-dependent 2,4-dienoyl-CoA reductase/sulfur reductase-like enzyme
MRFLIIGGSDAGISAALRAQEFDPRAEITVLLEDEFPNYSICGLPFFLSGETPNWRSLAHRTDFGGVHILTRHRALHIDPSAKTVAVQVNDSDSSILTYDKLLIATGATPIRPPIEGIDLPGVFFLHSMRDSFAMHDYLDAAKPRRAIIVGAGYIGLEMADALTQRGIEVTIASRSPSVLATVDQPLGDAIAGELRRHGVSVHTDVEVHSISMSAGCLQVDGSGGFSQAGEIVLMAVGVQPNTHLGVESGFQVGSRGALLTTRQMRSAMPDIYIAGDCAETWHRLLKRHTYLPLGTTSHKQGRIAGENAVGGNEEFAGSLGTQVVKVFQQVIGRTGLNHEEARREGFEPWTVESSIKDHKAYYPGATDLRIRVTGDFRSGVLLGAQLQGIWGAEVSKRLDIFATAIFHDMQVDQLSQLDLSYTPPLSSPWDPVQTAAQDWSTHRKASKSDRRS